ncbi:MAG TPA: type IV pilus assembly protein PilM [Candidatus Paceibacterota bacterium]|nr:type IV pilus assembly protein PilM [Candidatus Paceibacterota bacterium]
MSILDGIKHFFSQLFGGGDDAMAVGVDIGSSSIKVVELKKESGRALLTTYGALSLGQYKEGGVLGEVVTLDAATIAKALTDVFKETNIMSKNVVVGIPSISCIIFILQLPASIEESGLAQAVPIESKKFIPIPIEDVSLDWYVIPRREDSGTEARVLSESGGEAKLSVLVVATLNETLVKYTEVLKKAGLPMDNLEIEIFSHIRSVLTRELFPVLIVDIGASKTKLTIVEHGIVETFRLVNRGSQDMTHSIANSLEISFEKAEMIKKDFGMIPSPEHPSVADMVKTHFVDIFQEANTNILAYEKRYNKSIGKVIFTGGGAMTKGLLEYASENFSAELVIADPFAKVESPLFLSGVLKTTGPEFSIALGLALKKFQ